MRESEAFKPGPYRNDGSNIFSADGQYLGKAASEGYVADIRATLALWTAAPDLYEALDEGDAAWAEAMILIAAKPHDNDRARLAAERLHAWNDKRKAALRKAGKQFCATCNAADPPHAPGCAAHSPRPPQTDCMEQP